MKTTTRVVMFFYNDMGIIQNLLDCFMLASDKALHPFHGAVIVEYHDQAFTKQIGTLL